MFIFLVSRLTITLSEINGNHQFGFRRYRSISDKMIRYYSSVTGEKWEYSGSISVSDL